MGVTGVRRAIAGMTAKGIATDELIMLKLTSTGWLKLSCTMWVRSCFMGYTGFEQYKKDYIEWMKSFSSLLPWWYCQPGHIDRSLHACVYIRTVCVFVKCIPVLVLIKALLIWCFQRVVAIYMSPTSHPCYVDVWEKWNLDLANRALLEVYYLLQGLLMWKNQITMPV